MDSNTAPIRSRLIASSDIDRFCSISSSLQSENRSEGVDNKKNNLFSNNLYLNKISHKQEHYLRKSNSELSSEVTWRLKERMKTSGVALVVCLNIGIDPPDIIKPTPCARKECWFDPTLGSGSKQKGLEFIGHALQQQYEKWQSKAKYKQCLDPTSEELRRICMNLRKSSRNDRLLLHFNGHGVPKPTKNGELWVFGKYYTHYTPVAVCELRSWLGDPAIYVLDCSAAGILIPHLVDNTSATSPLGMDRSYNENERFDPHSNIQHQSSQQQSIDSPTIVLAACRANEILPFNPLYPADLFTSCLTTPITIAIRWFILQNPYSMADVNPDVGGNIPGKDTDRKSPRGELNWIFTAITDTIAWTSLPSKTFQKMFRQDLLVASLFRNFLLARRIMKSFNCNPQSFPYLPDTSTHHLWQSWDMTLESFISNNVALQKGASMIDPLNNMPFQLNSNLTFFTDQLTAFDLWLDFSSSTSEPPEYLPIVLQVLLSQTHRLRALQLLKRYLALGTNAVNLSLVVGIYPYILKLLQSPTEDIKQTLIAIWASIIGFDSSCRQELIREKSQSYFIQFLQSKGTPSTQRCMAAFVLAEICNQYREGQQTCLNLGLHRSCTSILSQPEVMESVNLKKWISLCLFKLCEDFPWAKYLCITETTHTQLYPLLIDSDPTVRTASLLALGEIFGASKLADSLAAGAGSTSAPSTPNRSNSFRDSGGGSINKSDIEDKDLREAELHLAWQMLDCCTDGAVSVRLEVIIALSKCFLLPAHIECTKIVAKAVYKINKLKKKARNTKISHHQSSETTDAIDQNASKNQSIFHPWLLSPAETDTVIVLVEQHIQLQSQQMEQSASLLNSTAHHNNTFEMNSNIGNFHSGNSKNWLKPLNTLPEDVDDPMIGDMNELIIPNSDMISNDDAKERINKDESSAAPSLYGLMASVYVRVWLALTELQGKDPSPIVVDAAKMFRSKVYMLILFDEKQETDFQSTRSLSYSSSTSPMNSTKMSSSYLNFALGSNTNSPLNSPNFYSRKSYKNPGTLLDTKNMDESKHLSGDVALISKSVSQNNMKSPALFPLSFSDNNLAIYQSTPISANNMSGTGEFKSYRLPSQQSMGTIASAETITTTTNIGDSHNKLSSNQNQFIKDISFHKDFLIEKSFESNEFLLEIISNTYQEAKQSFLKPDEGYDPIEDPLSIEGSNKAFRMKSIAEIISHQMYLTNLFKEISSSDDKTDLYLSSSEAKLKSNLISDDNINNNIQQSRSAVSNLPANVTKFEEKALLTINNAVMTSLVMFHPFYDILAVSDESNISIWSLTKSSRIMEISNKHSILHNDHHSDEVLAKISLSESSIFAPLAEPRITAMHWINESYDSLLLVGTDDGVVKVWRDVSVSCSSADDATAAELSSSSFNLNHNNKDLSNSKTRPSKSVDYKENSTVELSTAFAALPDIAETSRGSGLLLSWQQSTGTLIAAGNSSTIRVWDLGREQCVRVFDTGSKTCLTALAATTSANIYNPIYTDPHTSAGAPNISSDYSSNLPLSWTFTGFADGTVAVFDERVQSNGGRVYQSRDHNSWIVSAHIKLDAMEAITSSVRGSVKFWDMRTLRIYKTLDVQKSSLTSMTVHNTLPIIATGSHAQFIKILTFGGEQLGNIIKYHDGFLGQRIGPITSLAFHPHRMMLAASAADCIVSVYGTNDAIHSN